MLVIIWTIGWFLTMSIENYLTWKVLGERYFDKKYDDGKAFCVLIEFTIWIVILYHLW